MTAADAKKRGMLPVYAFHVWELLATINCLSRLLEKRARENRQTQLDEWVNGFIERLSVLASVMIHTQKDGIVYLRQQDRELVRQLSQWIQVNGLI